MMASGVPSQDAAKWGEDQKCPRMDARFTRPVNSARSLRAGTPLREFTSTDTAAFGG